MTSVPLILGEICCIGCPRHNPYPEQALFLIGSSHALYILQFITVATVDFHLLRFDTLKALPTFIEERLNESNSEVSWFYLIIFTTNSQS